MLQPDPKCVIPYTERELPHRANPRRLKDDPKWKKSSKDMHDAHRTKPYTESVDPKRANDRIEHALPKWPKSRTDKAEDRRATP
jgi:hypothetical protein